jgi:DNA repair protein RadA/Sms
MKIKKRFVCQECGYDSPKWMGKCPGCDTWNKMVEETGPARVSALDLSKGLQALPKLMDEIDFDGQLRIKTGINEVDRVFGGGIVEGSLTLIGGDPGIGKSTLLLQICDALAGKSGEVLYVSGEESLGQIKMRANRLNITGASMYLVSETNMTQIQSHVARIKPKFLVIDSIQTVYADEVSSAPGSVSQVRECTSVFMELSKREGICVFLVGHVTKEGAMAGPRVLEHMVDTVLYFEGDKHHAYRVIRAIKNRFGSTNEIGLFEMRESGLIEVSNPSELMLSGRSKGASGSVVLCGMEGTRPMLVEIQALVSATAFGMARRMSAGVDYNRIVLLMAVLEKKAGMQLYDQDVYVNVAGGFKVEEPAADLAIVTAVASSFRNIPIAHDTVVMGEVGLTGEVRGISRIESRIAESSRMGFRTCVIPEDNVKGLKTDSNIRIFGVKSIPEALKHILGR